ncbi:MAG: selenocysteine-specific translation elongation factor [Chloroflexaceae bacterium]|jgi:selenocysteine-specific elongation factor|nr:selenocysteine-specific translation elongation factor [Chloroflexaceae bacterium]
MYVVGTAGHVDHGKSTLVKTLTGIDPDRWEEEQRREMTIDLGFAWLTLPSGRSLSVVDVPGHERFIKNMLAGVGGLDAAMLIIAADESVMPQTEEHLAILDLLGVSHGLVALTKVDLVDDDWLALVEDEVRERLSGTSFAHVPLVPVSARSGQGLPKLLATLDHVLDGTPSRSSARGVPRLPLDRSFTIGGFGTVVTGTLLDGTLAVGQEVEILPAGLRARVRGLQTHQQKAELALPGSRVAVNLAGVHHSQVQRGDVLTLPGNLVPTSLVDMALRLVPHTPRPLEQNDALDLFVGAAEVRCRVTLLERERLAPGETGWVQLRLERPITAMRGDRCILRQPSPSLTVGGGSIVDTAPPRHRRFRADVIASLETLARGNPADLLLQALADGAPCGWDELLKRSGMADHVARSGLTALLSDGRVLLLGRHAGEAVALPESLAARLLISHDGWQKLATRLSTALRGYHERFPLRTGMPREELRQRLKLDGRGLAAVLAEAAGRGLVQFHETATWLTEHVPTPTPAQRREVDELLAAVARAPYSPPPPELEPELLAWMLEQGLLVKTSDEIYFSPVVYAELLAWVRATIASDGGVTVGQFRDRFGSSRKYALAFLEHLDEQKITRRMGDVRVHF